MKSTIIVCSLIVVSVFFGACHTMQYRADDDPVITMKKSKSCKGDRFKEKETAKFYICGLVPGKNVVNLTEIAENNGAGKGACDVKIEEEFTFVDQLLGCCTLGIYTPMTYEVKGRKLK